MEEKALDFCVPVAIEINSPVFISNDRNNFFNATVENHIIPIKASLNESNGSLYLAICEQQGFTTGYIELRDTYDLPPANTGPQSFLSTRLISADAEIVQNLTLFLLEVFAILLLACYGLSTLIGLLVVCSRSLKSNR